MKGFEEIANLGFEPLRSCEYFDLGQKPIFRRSFTLGKGVTGKRGIFVMENTCIECGACKQRCPEECIAAGSPYSIDQDHCIRCGICEEACPAGAVAKR